MATARDIDQRDANLWLEFGGSYDADGTTTDLMIDGSMEAADTTAYTVPAFGVLTKEVASPHSGTRCLRIAYQGNAVAYARQAGRVTIGYTYTVDAWLRGDGTRAPQITDAVNFLWTGTSSTEWQHAVVTFVAAGASINFYNGSMAPGAWFEVDDVKLYAQKKRVIDNLAERGDAPRTVTNGDGVTAATFVGQPTNGKRGIIFDANTKYLDTSLLYPTLRTRPFTVFALVGLYGQTFWGLCGTRAGDASALGFDIQLGTAATTDITTLISNDAGAGKYMQVQSTLPVKLVAVSGGVQLVSVAVTYSGTGTAAGINHYANGAALAKTTLMDSLGANDFASPNGFRIGKRASLGGAAVRQDMYAFMLFPNLAASQLQVSNLHKRIMRRINLP